MGNTYFDRKSFVKYPLEVAPREGFLYLLIIEKLQGRPKKIKIYHLPPNEKPDCSLSTGVTRRHIARYKFI